VRLNKQPVQFKVRIHGSKQTFTVHLNGDTFARAV